MTSHASSIILQFQSRWYSILQIDSSYFEKLEISYVLPYHAYNRPHIFTIVCSISKLFACISLHCIVNSTGTVMVHSTKIINICQKPACIQKITLNNAKMNNHCRINYSLTKNRSHHKTLPWAAIYFTLNNIELCRFCVTMHV